MAKYIKWILAVVVVLAAGIVAAVYVMIKPYWTAGSSMPQDGTVTIIQGEDGDIHLTWPESDTADAYLVEVIIPGQGPLAQAQVLYARYVEDGTSCVLPKIQSEDPLTVRIRSAVNYVFLEQERIRLGSNVLEVEDVYSIPAVSSLTWEPDPDAKSVLVKLGLRQGDTCRLYSVDSNGELTLMRTLKEGQTQITFGEGADAPMPAYGETVTFAVDAYRKTDGAISYGLVTKQFSVTREDLLTTDLGLVCEDLGNNSCELTWNETKGEYYEVQIRNDSTGEWMTLERFGRDDERSYTSPQLQKFQSFRFRVVAIGGQTLPDSKYAAVSETARFTTGVTTTYTTIWPLQKLDVYDDTQRSNVIGTAPAGAAYCVLELKDGMFQIRLDAQTYGYIDSNYCMVNLPEYMGSLCSYNITNSFASRYMVHGYGIPEVTETVIKGYEKIQLASGNYLVPLLYPAAKKLVDAAGDALSQGYRLKIYDSFRPNKASRSIYSLTSQILGDYLPERKHVFADGSGDPPGIEGFQAMTYEELMTNGQYNLASFLAANTSTHNYGVALDLTLESLGTEEELQMQSSIHDLSWYSVVSRNNENANILDKIMKDAGFGGLASEWWHFQDNDARSGLELQALYEGVSAACWMKDDGGWKYRKADGNYYRSKTVKISGVEYTFDEYGYVVE